MYAEYGIKLYTILVPRYIAHSKKTPELQDINTIIRCVYGIRRYTVHVYKEIAHCSWLLNCIPFQNDGLSLSPHTGVLPNGILHWLLHAYCLGCVKHSSRRMDSWESTCGWSLRHVTMKLCTRITIDIDYMNPPSLDGLTYHIDLPSTEALYCYSSSETRLQERGAGVYGGYPSNQCKECLRPTTT